MVREALRRPFLFGRPVATDLESPGSAILGTSIAEVVGGGRIDIRIDVERLNESDPSRLGERLDFEDLEIDVLRVAR